MSFERSPRLTNPSSSTTRKMSSQQQSDHLRRSLLSAITGHRDGTASFLKSADEIEQNVVNKRLRLGESVVDLAQPSLTRAGKAVIGALSNESKREPAVRELVRYELGPIKTCQAIIETSQRETALYKQQLTELETGKDVTLQGIHRLKSELAEAKTFPRDEVEKLAKECNKMPTKTQTEATIRTTKIEIARLEQQRKSLQTVVEARKQTLIKLAQTVEDFRQECM